MSPSGVLRVALGVVTIGAVVLLSIGLVRRQRRLVVNSVISVAFLAFFLAITLFGDEDNLSSTGQAILTGVAVAGIVEFANALRIHLEAEEPG